MSSAPSATIATKRLEGKVALITGGASGIGESTSRLFVKHGAKVLIADVQDALGLSLCQEFDSQETISYVHCDVSCDSDVQNAVDTAVSRYGKLDIMFNNAGISGKQEGRIVATENEDFKKVLGVNTFGAFLGAKHAARVMIPAKKGCILFTSSIVSVCCMECPHAYVASKYAVVGLAKNLCEELGKYGIRVNSISPYAVATPLLRNSLGMMEKKEAEDIFASVANLKEVVLEADDIAALFPEVLYRVYIFNSLPMWDSTHLPHAQANWSVKRKWKLSPNIRDAQYWMDDSDTMNKMEKRVLARGKQNNFSFSIQVFCAVFFFSL